MRASRHGGRRGTPQTLHHYSGWVQPHRGFDIKNRRLLDPIPSASCRTRWALGTDGSTLYVGNTGGESLQTVISTLKRVSSNVEFPPLPRQGGEWNANPAHPRALAIGLFGLQFVMSNGSQLELVRQ